MVAMAATADSRAATYLEQLGLPAVEGWKFEVARRAGVDVAVVATKGPEIHFVSLTPGRAMTRRNTLQFLEPILAEHGYATTRVPIAETDHKLREHLGFTETWRDHAFTYWALTEIPFKRK